LDQARSAVKRFAAFLSLLPLALGHAAVRPNIVYILADDLGYGDAGCYNPDSKIPTPRIDLLARQGRRFTDAHAADSVCTPSRYAILTGRYAFRSRLKHGVLEPLALPLIEPGRPTLAGLLSRAGYATVALGKWHLGWNWPTRDGKVPDVQGRNVDFSRRIADGPTTLGFDSYFGVDIPNFPPYGFIVDDHLPVLPSVPAPMIVNRIHRPGPMVPGWKLEEILPEITRHAVRYIETAATAQIPKPFFLYFALTAPHYPVVPTAEFKGKSRAGDYGDYVAEVDAMVGKVLDALDRTGQTDNTLVCFSSDNGPEVIEVNPAAYARIKLYGHRSMDGLRGAKRDIWEGGHRIPFIARWPRHIPAGTTTPELICEMDLMATVSALLQLPLPAGAAEDSANILPALLGTPHAEPVRPTLVLHTATNQYGIRSGNWVFIDAPSGSGNAPRGREPLWLKQERGYVDDSFPGELYNLHSDLTEQRNLYGEHPEIVRRMKALLEPYEAASRQTAAVVKGTLPDE
jgi:arylsulfatase A